MSPVQGCVAVAVGGALGSVLRFLIHELFVSRGWQGYGLATLAANVLGCLLAGLALAWFEVRPDANPVWRPLLLAGFLGGLTTFSALSVELWQYLRASRYDLVLLSASISLLLGVASIALGSLVGRTLWR